MHERHSRAVQWRDCAVRATRGRAGRAALGRPRTAAPGRGQIRAQPHCCSAPVPRP
ncbi:hypothetical protein ACFPM0_18390 [Pseudonocardia sulfidoxydans]|uniref:hypothetical protein n=1 Tax=Pseudonocardia sulfidoxydans TaxID=54011 RepID=UPI003616DB63